jgi:cation diffusion facilitator CzcD-associated flavoprotein CzcO
VGTAKKTEKFDSVVVATGIYTKPYIPDIPGRDKFTGTLLHSKDYKTPKDFESKRVMVVGGAYSGAEIAAEIAASATHVMNVVNNPFWILPRYISKSSEYRIICYLLIWCFINALHATFHKHLQKQISRKILTFKSFAKIKK